jgi:hypothetical protein
MKQSLEAIITFPDEASAWKGLEVADKALGYLDPREADHPRVRFDLEPSAFKPLTGPPQMWLFGLGNAYLEEVIRRLEEALIQHQLKTPKSEDWPHVSL